jgi:hypothetical protein
MPVSLISVWAATLVSASFILLSRTRMRGPVTGVKGTAAWSFGCKAQTVHSYAIINQAPPIQSGKLAVKLINWGPHSSADPSLRPPLPNWNQIHTPHSYAPSSTLEHMPAAPLLSLSG